MFRKLQKAANDLLHGENDVSRLTALGFSRTQAESALQACNGSVDRAAELLLAGGGGGSGGVGGASVQQQQQQEVVDLTHDADDDLQRAIQQSMQEQQRPQQRPQQPQRTAAMNKAAEAAQRRAAAGSGFGTSKTQPKQNNHSKRSAAAAQTNQKNKAPPPQQQQRQPPPLTASAILRTHHPDVRLVPKLQDKSVEERILRTADRMKSYPAAVDTLHKALTALQNNPDEAKFRRIDTSSAGYQRSVAPAPGAADFLATMAFQQDYTTTGSNSILILHRPLYDPALIYLGLSALQQTQLTTEYCTAKQQLVFTKELQNLLSQDAVSAQEKQKRLALRKQLPKEPPSGTLLQIRLGDQQTIRRRFDADDTVADLLNWLGATAGTEFLDRIVATAEWCLVDVNRNPAAVLDCSTGPAYTNRTLQYVGCWPSGRLEVRPAAIVNTAAAAGESRGLASGASSDTD